MFAVIVIFLLFFNTYIFQAGLVNILINKFKVVISVTFVYFALCVGLHVWYMVSSYGIKEMPLKQSICKGFNKNVITCIC